MKQIARDVVGELLETGKQTVKQMGSVPGKIAGTAKKPSPKRSAKPVQPPPLGGLGKTTEPVFQDGPLPPSVMEKNIPPAKMADNQLMKMIKSDNQHRTQGIDSIRQQLAQLKIKRYKEIQQEIQKIRQKKEQEIPEYEAGRPGAPRTRKEQLEMQEKQAKAAKPKLEDQTPVLPSSEKSKRGSLFSPKKKTIGSGEKRLGKQG